VRRLGQSWCMSFISSGRGQAYGSGFRGWFSSGGIFSSSLNVQLKPKKLFIPPTPRLVEEP
jgi:hypothetical protein